MERRQEIRFGLWLILVPLALMVAGELGAYYYYRTQRPQAFDFSALEYATRVPGEDTPYRFQPHASYEHLNFDEFGMRSPPLALPKPEDTIRLAVVSNSTLFNAILPEEQTFAAQVVRELSERYPECNFDYSNFSGPAYNLAFLAEEWPAVREQVRPDITLILAGSPYESIVDAPARRALRKSPRTKLLEKSNLRRLIRAVMKRISLPDKLSSGREETAQFKAEFAESLERMKVSLASLAPEGPVLLIGDRAQVRAEFTGLQLADQTRELRFKKRLKSPEEALALTEATVSTMADEARALGWRFSDAMTSVPADPVYFRDAAHLTLVGVNVLVERVVPEIEAILPNCGSRGAQ